MCVVCMLARETESRSLQFIGLVSFDIVSLQLIYWVSFDFDMNPKQETSKSASGERPVRSTSVLMPDRANTAVSSAVEIEEQVLVKP